eukprot:gene2394-8702_t
MSASPVFVVLVTGKLKPGFKEQFIANFKPLAEFVEKNEDGCYTYQLSFGNEDPDSLSIYERYISKEYVETVHWQSEPFKAFGAATRALGDIWETKAVVKYDETPVGFMAR